MSDIHTSSNQATKVSTLVCKKTDRVAYILGFQAGVGSIDMLQLV